MVFASPVFLFLFLPLFLTGYYLIPRGHRMGWIVLGSWIFYGWWRPDVLPLLVGASLWAAFVTARAARAARSGMAVRARRWTAAGVVGALGLLAWFKYAGFAAASVAGVAEVLGLPAVPVPQVLLPIGISFFTFQIVSYIVDVHRGTAPEARRVVDVLAYVTLFPQLIAGPIVRYSDVADQLVERRHSPQRFGDGMARFMVGLARKVLIADAVAPLVDAVFAHPTPGLFGGWLGTVAYAIQIYFDFAAYSDMAIGLGAMIGFRFPENFDMPYLSRSITEFWRRWHMTLSRWLRDYLYIPLGGSRLGRRRTLLNLMTVMVLGGLWHGAAWTFVLWGAWHGCALVVERILGVDRRGGLHLPARMVTLLIVLFGWVLFRAEGLGQVVAVGGGMLGLQTVALPSTLLWQLDPGALAALAVGITVVAAEPGLRRLASAPGTGTAVARFAIGAVAFVASVARVLAASYSPFLYFQF